MSGFLESSGRSRDRLAQGGGGVVAVVGDHLLVGGQRVRGPAPFAERDARVVQRLGDLFAQGGGGVVAVVGDHLLVGGQRVRGPAQHPERDARVEQRCG